MREQRGQFGLAADAEGVVDGGEVVADRGRRELAGLGDFLVRLAAGEGAGNLDLARAQPVDGRAAVCSDAACANRYVVGSGARTFDIASGTAGSAIGSYAKVDAVPNGVYTHVRLVLHRTFVISGLATGGGCAAPANAASISVNNDGTWDASLLAIGITWNDPPAKTQMAMIGTLPTPMVVTKGAKRPSVIVKFDTQQGLMCDGAGTYLPGLPTTTLTVF